MMVMPANSTGIHCGYLAGRYPGRLGHDLAADRAHLNPVRLRSSSGSSTGWPATFDPLPG